MNDFVTSPTTWLIFAGVFSALLVGDILLTLRAREVHFREALILTIFIKSVGVALGIWILFTGDSIININGVDTLVSGTQLGIEYLSSYIAESALSLDNIFIFLVIFNYFGVPAKYRPRGLLIGIFGALIARGIFIAISLTLISLQGWVSLTVFFIFGFFLVYTAYKIWRQDENEQKDPSKSIVIRATRRLVPVTNDYHGYKIFIRQNAKWIATPFLLVIISLITTDIIFAVDSIPTVLGISTVPLIVWSSNAMAVLGLRPLYFLVADLVASFHLLKYGLALILGFVGAKIIANHTVELLHQLNLTELEHLIPNIGNLKGSLVEAFISLAVIIIILTSSIILSRVIKPKTPREI